MGRKILAERLLIFIKLNGCDECFFIGISFIQGIAGTAGQIVKEDLSELFGIDGTPVGRETGFKAHEDRIALHAAACAAKNGLAAAGGKDGAAFSGALCLEGITEDGLFKPAEKKITECTHPVRCHPELLGESGRFSVNPDR